MNLLLNDRLKPTFNNDRSSSYIDVSSVLAANANWMVREDITLSDHNVISFSVKRQTTKPIPRQQRSALGLVWDIKKLDEDILAYQIELIETSNGHAETMVAALMNTLKATCDAVMPRKTNAKRKPPVYWWSASLRQIRTECLRARRLAQRSRGYPHHAQCIETYKAKRAKFKYDISAAKANAFEDLLASVDDDTWGLAYKVVRKKLNGAGAGTPQDPG